MQLIPGGVSSHYPHFLAGVGPALAAIDYGALRPIQRLEIFPMDPVEGLIDLLPG